MDRRRFCRLLAGGLCFLTLAAAGGKDPLDKAFRRWFKAYRADRIHWNEVVGKDDPFLPRAYVRSFPAGRRPYTRIDEAAELFRLLAQRGRTRDAEALLDVFALSLERAAKRGRAVGIGEWRVRRALTRALAGRDVPAAVQAALADRVRKGLVRKKGKKGPVWTHAEPALAGALLPILGSYHAPSLRHLLEDCLEVDDPRLLVGAARALAALGSGASLPALAGILRRLELPEDVRPVADAIVALADAKRPPPSERALQQALTAAQEALRRLKSWRARLPLVRVLRRIRGVSSIPVLLDLLEECAVIPKSGEAPVSGTLRAAVHEALVDLTGFYAGPTEPAKWRAFWERVEDSFELPPPRKLDRARKFTVAKSFFGIPVSGTRVVFVLDVSGSMAAPYGLGTAAAGPQGRSRSGLSSRLERAKKELLKAVGGLPPDARFNVVFFNSSVRLWRKRLVKANAGNKRALAADLARLNARGGTALYDALSKGLKIQTLRKRGARYRTPIDEVFLLSDGAPSVGLVDPEEILLRVREWNQGANVRINTIFIGDQVPVRGPRGPLRIQPGRFMERLARENGGLYRRPVR